MGDLAGNASTVPGTLALTGAPGTSRGPESFSRIANFLRGQAAVSAESYVEFHHSVASAAPATLIPGDELP